MRHLDRSRVCTPQEGAGLSALIIDPSQFPLDGVAGENAIDAGRLTAGFLRERLAHPPQWEAEQGWVLQKGEAYWDAAVLMPIVMHASGPTILLTQRTVHLTHHAGQISFPGGRREPGDASLQATALRETEEEVGLGADKIELLGSLPDYFTGTGYKVTPVVGLVRPPVEIHSDPQEVAEVFEVPMAFAMDGRHHQRRSFVPANTTVRRSIYAIPYDRFFIWGATAGMLRNLFHLLRA